jgi:hypothetical protein
MRESLDRGEPTGVEGWHTQDTGEKLLRAAVRKKENGLVAESRVQDDAVSEFTKDAEAVWRGPDWRRRRALGHSGYISRVSESHGSAPATEH